MSYYPIAETLYGQTIMFSKKKNGIDALNAFKEFEENYNILLKNMRVIITSDEKPYKRKIFVEREYKFKEERGDKK